MSTEQIDESYKKLLDKFYGDLPKVEGSGEWFSIPNPVLRYQGDKTTFTNFKQVCELFRREPSHVMKFLVKHLATAGFVDPEGKLVLQGHFSESQLKELLGRYVDFYVKCPTCGRPDTRLVKKLRIVYMVCEACGAEAPIKVKG